MDQDTDVLVVGAGPTGLMLANQLGRRGVRVRIIDRHGGPALQTRALGVQARTLEIYSHLGIVDNALELGKRATGAELWAGGRRAARVPLAVTGLDLSPYPFLLILGQDDTEKLLGQALGHWGVRIEWNTELVDLTQTADGVTAALRQPDGTTRSVRAAWVAGCDGAHSAVRDKSGIAFVGAPYEHVFFVADVQMTGPMIPDEVNVFFQREGFHLFFPMRGADHWRVVGILPAGLRDKPDLAFEDVAPTIQRQAETRLTFQQCSWFSAYRIHHRRAARFRDGRCFVLGDAAHIHSPVGAQGMNTGLQDAYNLGWKLALVQSQLAGSALLDSYEAERIPVAERLLATTDRAFSVAVSDSSAAGFFRTRLMPRMLALAMSIDGIRRFAFRAISQIGIAYPASPLSETLPEAQSRGPRAGDRFPWLRVKLSADGPIEDIFEKVDDTRFALIAVGQSNLSGALSRFDDLVQRLTIPDDPANQRQLDRAEIPRLSFYLVRPDGHIGLVGRRLEMAAVVRYLTERIALH